LYPVLSEEYEEYAREIAEKWNANDPQSGYVGYVTVFHLRMEFASRFPAKQVGDVHHRELWIPAERMQEFNRNIVGPIEVIAEFGGSTPAGAK
jgi:hypothetical protein